MQLLMLFCYFVNKKMDEDKVLRNRIAEIKAQKVKENIERLNNTLPISKEIIDRDYVINNDINSAVLVEKGKRRSIYRKEDIYFLGDTNGNFNKLYFPTKDYESIYQEFIKANLM